MPAGSEQGRNNGSGTAVVEQADKGIDSGKRRRIAHDNCETQQCPAKTDKYQYRAPCKDVAVFGGRYGGVHAWGPAALCAEGLEIGGRI